MAPLEIKLPAPMPWLLPGAAVLAGIAAAAFVAVRSGGTALTVIDDTACLHGQPACKVPQHEWQVTVIVTGGCRPPVAA